MDNHFCEACDRTFSNQEALEMHNKAKHSSAATAVSFQSIKRSKIPTRKKVAYTGYVIGTLLIIWGLYRVFTK